MVAFFMQLAVTNQIISFGSFLRAGLYTTFIFQKPDPDFGPPLMTPYLQDGSYNQDEASTCVVTQKI